MLPLVSNCLIVIEGEIQFGFDEERTNSNNFIGIVFYDNDEVGITATTEPVKSFYRVNSGTT